MEQEIKAEWEFWCKQNAELAWQEIAQARKVADFIANEYKQFKRPEFDVHVGEVSEAFIHKVAYFCPPLWVLKYTDEERGWNNYIRVTVK